MGRVVSGMDQKYPDAAASAFWLDQVFAAQAAAKGGVIRRNRQWIDREIGRDRFVAEVRQRGFHLFETGDQLLVVCHNGPIRKLC